MLRARFFFPMPIQTKLVDTPLVVAKGRIAAKALVQACGSKASPYLATAHTRLIEFLMLLFNSFSTHG